ncbi:hypothetical protein scyTo_0002320 [Scyliorhinus torazame]|uniref:Uncharacterized protein n=1 Tax=Scyliorhinus torazame TaxID=75743 RepID=A0A401PIU8_SCYTO|nr:hypothetical protein [Scyliorhinus torazame]
MNQTAATWIGRSTWLMGFRLRYLKLEYLIGRQILGSCLTERFFDFLNQYLSVGCRRSCTNSLWQLRIWEFSNNTGIRAGVVS